MAFNAAWLFSVDTTEALRPYFCLRPIHVRLMQAVDFACLWVVDLAPFHTEKIVQRLAPTHGQVAFFVARAARCRQWCVSA